jgi:hypothetical protein
MLFAPAACSPSVGVTQVAQVGVVPPDAHHSPVSFTSPSDNSSRIIAYVGRLELGGTLKFSRGYAEHSGGVDVG